MGLFTEPFPQAKESWNLEKLVQDLTKAKQQYCGKRKKLTPVEIACLHGLLCGFSPTEIAAELKREPRGLRVDLSRGLYRYVEVLAEREPNELNDWRDVVDWLSAYQTPSTIANDSAIKIVDIALEGSNQVPVLDIKVRNVGQQVAFLKKARFHFYKTWILHSWIPEIEMEAEAELIPCESRRAFRYVSAKSRVVEPSFNYEISLNEVDFEILEFQQKVNSRAENKPLNSANFVTQEFNISQCVDCQDVDRFTMSLNLPKKSLKMGDFGYTTQINHLKLEIIYDEDDKIVESQNLILGIEPPDYPPLRDRCFFYTPDQVNTHNLEDYSEINQTILEEIAKIQGLHNPILEQILLIFHSHAIGAFLLNAPT